MTARLDVVASVHLGDGGPAIGRGMQLLIHDAAGAKVHVSTLDIAGVLETAPVGVDSGASVAGDVRGVDTHPGVRGDSGW